MTGNSADDTASGAPISVGIIGFGLVGTAYAQRLAEASNPPYVVPQDPAVPPAAHGVVRKVLTLDQLLQTCRVAIVCVYSTAQAVGVLQRLARSRTNATVLDTVLCATTLDPDSVESLVATATAGGLRFVEYPVSGTSVQIRHGEGLGLLSGDETVIEAHRELIEILTPRWHYLGPARSASLAKLAVNLVLEVNRSALAEGLVFASRVGLDPNTFLPALMDSAAYSRVMDGKAPKMLSGEFSAEGRAAQSLKDVEMMLATGAGAGQILPLTSAQAILLRAVVEAGDGELDSSVVFRAIAALGERALGE